MQKIINDMVTWLQEQVKDAKVNGLVVGLSGGLDSAVVAHLIKLACPNKALAVIMPIHTQKEDLEDAYKVVDSSGIQTINIDLTASHDLLLHTTVEALSTQNLYQKDRLKMTDANLRARIRMNTLYSVATQLNYLVVGTDNAAEWYTGYFTKHGDGGVDLQPIIDLTKSEVREMAEYLKVPPTVIGKPPSADLWEGQTDETELGTSYDAIDQFLNGEPIDDHDRQVIEGLHKKTAHKRDIARQFRFK